MRRLLLFVSLMTVVQLHAINLEGKRQYNVIIETGKASLSGICIIKTDETGSKGAIVNEFGIQALDFTLSADRRKVRLHHVVDFLNRWYIKRVLRKDLQFIFRNIESTSDRNRELRVEGDTTIMQNRKHHITYTFTETQDETDQ